MLQSLGKTLEMDDSVKW